MADADNRPLSGDTDKGRNNVFNGVFIRVPAYLSEGRSSVHTFEINNDQGDVKRLADVTLPAGTKIGDNDVSFYSFVVTEKHLDPGGQQPPSGLPSSARRNILLPAVNNKTGEPWKVRLTRNFQADNGDYIKNTAECTSTELRDACQAQQDMRREM